MDASTCAYHEDAEPEEGDFTLCMRCGEIFRFDGNLEAKPVMVADLIGLHPQTASELDRAQQLIRKERVLDK